ncbi:HPr family phosphocarrier protein [Paenibacillus lutimineralis]|uniref:Phosphocarrier protein HPr n=1 Tax=Paenibacillus lutimineralis TaxID=2707005 RepID=A0A3Q9I9P0_9BACL|nr:HPr family phosphocarrier protein [Paenibacillus lutimineralis]AZS14304.1 HPr family phosphocarrier protein [Paenibacillus lutimineralis]
MTTQTVQVMNKVGIHARPASMLVTAAGQFQSVITVNHGDKTATANSMIDLLTLRVKMNDTVTIQANGVDEKEAVDALTALIQSKFGEE